MITLMAIISSISCLLVSWVSGCFLLHSGRPLTGRATTLKLALLGVCVYGVGAAMLPMSFDVAPALVTVLWRVALASVAAILYDRVFGWAALGRQLFDQPRRLVVWVRSHIDQGRRPPPEKPR